MRSRSTRATAPAPACRWSRTAPTTSAFGDINALIELAAKKPDDAPIAVYVMFNQPPFTVAVKADSPIKTPKDFEGKTLGGAANDGALKLFPGALQARQDRLHQGQHHQHAAEPARADADAGTGRRRVRLRQHHPLLRQADGRRGQPAPLHQLRRLRHGPLFQRHHRLQEAGEGKSEGGRRPRPRDQQGADQLAEGSRRLGRRRRQA